MIIREWTVDDGRAIVGSAQWHLGTATWKVKNLKYNFGDYVVLLNGQVNSDIHVMHGKCGQ